MLLIGACTNLSAGIVPDEKKLSLDVEIYEDLDVGGTDGLEVSYTGLEGTAILSF